jgi:hypothetical protein
MSKFKLNLEDLKIESFTTSENLKTNLGTVKGQTGATCAHQCTYVDCQDSQKFTCQGTCYYTCEQIVQTCVSPCETSAETCFVTCEEPSCLATSCGPGCE